MEMSKALNLEPIRQPTKSEIIIELIDRALAEYEQEQSSSTS